MTDSQTPFTPLEMISAAQSGPPETLHTAFAQEFASTPEVFVRAPGRVNLLGGHVDMHGGAVINIAIDREVWLAASCGTTSDARIVAADLQEVVAFSRAGLERKLDTAGAPLPRWALYPAGMAWSLGRQGLEVVGIAAAFLGNVQMRAGLSSSAAVEVAFGIAWHALAGWPLDRQVLATAGNEVEREYMGIGSGIQDQFTCLHARRAHALQLDCGSLAFDYIPVPPTARIVVCDTNTRRELASSGYSGRARDGHDAARAVAAVNPEVRTLAGLAPSALDEYRTLLTPGQYQRARHVVTEIARVREGAAALQAGDLHRFGQLMNESYFSARDDYGSSSLALDQMWDAVTRQPGCYGARYSGGGEAGAVVALVDRAGEDSIMAAASDEYQRASGRLGTLFTVEPAAGAGVWR